MNKSRIARSIAQNLNLSSEDSVILEYGLKKVSMLIEDKVFTLICGWVLGVIVESMIFQISFTILRIHVGGYHAKSEHQCKVQSAIVTVLALILIKEIPFMTWYGYFAIILTSVFITAKAPVETKNKPLSVKEKYVNHKKSCVILILLNILSGIFMCLQWNFFVAPLIVAVIIVGMFVGLESFLANYRNEDNC